MKEKYYIEIILTTDQKIRLCLDSKGAPISVANFVDLVEKKYFDGVIFHRIIKDFMIQTGGYKINENNDLLKQKKYQQLKVSLQVMDILKIH